MPVESSGDRNEVLASVLETRPEHERKIEGSDLWQQLAPDDLLYVGDTIRTSENGHLKIQFLNTTKEIDIEPSSLLVLEKENGHINLDLLDGNLLVRTGNRKAPIAAQSIGTFKEEWTILVAGKNLQTQGLPSQESSSSGIEVLEPLNKDVLYVNPESTKEFRVAWRKSQPNWHVELLSGPSPELMTLQRKGPDGNESNLKIHAGHIFWQLQAKLGKKIVSSTPVYKTNIVYRYPPAPLSPLANGTIRLKQSSDLVQLSWFKDAEYRDVTIEIYQDKALKKILFSEKKSENTVSLNLAKGDYYWRLIGWPADSKESQPVVSSTYMFSVNYKNLEKSSITWDSQVEGTQYFVGEKGFLSLAWSVKSDNPVKFYRVWVSEEGKDLSEASVRIFNESSINIKLEKPGRYMAAIEAVDEDVEVIAKTSIRNFDIRALPLLSPPQINETELIGNEEGNVNLSWLPIEGAVSYQILLQDVRGQVLEKEDISQVEKSFIGLMPGSYVLKISAMDRYARLGRTQEMRVTVPVPAQLISPKIKKWEVD